MVKLITLTLRNFKGIRNLEINFDGENVTISGQNATGKTSVMDGWLWLLFGKDSLNRADFEIKPLDAAGEAEHGLEHEVTAEIGYQVENVLGGPAIQHLQLKKILTENWVKKRGSATSEFTGHTVKYFLDGVPVKEGEYKARIASITDEQTFRLLTNPRYFSEHLKWQDRRKVLLEACGDIADQEVIEASSKLSELPAILGKHNLDDHRKVLQGRKTEINKQLSDIPVRISEVKNTIVDGGAQDGPIRAKRAELEATRKGLDLELTTLESGGTIAEKKKALAEIETKLIELRNKESSQREADLETKRKDLNRMKFGLGALEADARNLSEKIGINERQVALAQETMTTLRSQWTTLNDTGFEAGGNCPTCKQPLPYNMVEASLAEFNKNKAEQLKNISLDGKRLKELCSDIEIENAKHSEVLTTKQSAIEKLIGEIAALEAIINAPTTYTDEYETKVFGLSKEKAKALDEIEAIQNNRQSAIDETKEKISALESEIQAHNEALAQIEQNKKSQARITELKAEERKLAGEYEKLEKELYLCDEFIHTKVSMLDAKINARFKLVSFKLFSENINGSIEPCCIATIAGVPYESLSNSERIKAGLDVVATLCDHYGIYAPIFADNAESTTEFPEMKSQLIKLYVSEKDKTLRIEKEKTDVRTKQGA